MSAPATIFEPINAPVCVSQPSFLADWVEMLVGPLRPFPTTLLTIKARADDADLSVTQLAVEQRRFRQEVIAICETFGAHAHAHSADTVAAVWLPSKTPSARERRRDGVIACVRAAFRTPLLISFTSRDLAVEPRLLLGDVGRRLGTSKETQRDGLATGHDQRHDQRQLLPISDRDWQQLEAALDRLLEGGRPRHLKVVLQSSDFHTGVAEQARRIWVSHGGSVLDLRPVSGSDRGVLQPHDKVMRDVTFQIVCAFSDLNRTDDPFDAVETVVGHDARAALTSLLADDVEFARDQIRVGQRRAIVKAALAKLLQALNDQAPVLLISEDPADTMSATSLLFDDRTSASASPIGSFQSVTGHVARLELCTAYSTVPERLPHGGSTTTANQAQSGCVVVRLADQIRTPHTSDAGSNSDHETRARALLSELAQASEQASLYSALAVFEIAFTATEAARLLSMSVHQLQSHLDALVARDLLAVAASNDGCLYSFPQTWMRATALSRVEASGQLELHKRASEVLSWNWHAANAATVMAALRAQAAAGHFEMANEPVNACQWFRKAGLALTLLGRHQDAEVAFTRALENTKNVKKTDDADAKSDVNVDQIELDVRLEIVRALHRRDRRSQRKVVSQLVRCQTLIDRIGPSAVATEIEVLAALAEVMRERGSFERCEEALARLTAIASETDLPVRAVYVGSEIMHCWNRGALTRAYQLGPELDRQRLLLPPPHFGPEQQVHRLAFRRQCFARAHLGLIAALRMDMAQSRLQLDRALGDIERMNEPSNHARVLILAATAAFWSRQTSLTSSLAMAIAAVCQRNDFPVRGSIASVLLAWCRREHAPDRALKVICHEIDQLKALKSNINLVLPQYLLANIYLARRQLDDAATAIRGAAKAAMATKFTAYAAEIERVDVVIGLESRFRTRAQSASRLRRAMDRARSQGALLFVGEIAQTAARYDLDISPRRTR